MAMSQTGWDLWIGGMQGTPRKRPRPAVSSGELGAAGPSRRRLQQTISSGRLGFGQLIHWARGPGQPLSAKDSSAVLK